jgi:hypothetical protein
MLTQEEQGMLRLFYPSVNPDFLWIWVQEAIKIGHCVIVVHIHTVASFFEWVNATAPPRRRMHCGLGRLMTKLTEQADCRMK